MPVFDYKCKRCNTKYDIFHKGKEILEDIQCPSCGSDQYIKLISLPSIITKESFPCDRGSCGMEKSCCSEMCGMN